MNQKLRAIASFIDQDDIVLDTCCDHAYLAIYLKKNELCQKVYASDINPNALNGAKKNILASQLDIPTYLSDGFKNIDVKDINTAVIAGVGANTVIDIIRYAPEHIQKFIISSNNHLGMLRKSLYQKGLYIKKEIAVLDKHKYYVIMLVTREYVKEDRISLKYGKSNHQDYYLSLLKKEQDVLQQIPKKQIFRQLEHRINIQELKRLIKRI